VKNLFSKAYALLMFGVAAVLAIFIVSFAVLGWSKSYQIPSAAVRVGEPQQSPWVQPPKPVEVEDYRDETISTPVVLTFNIYKREPHEGRLSGDFELKVSPSLKRQFEPRLSEITTCEEGASGERPQSGLKEQYQGKDLIIAMHNEAGSGRTKLLVPLRSLLASSIDASSSTCKQVLTDMTHRPSKLRLPAAVPVLASPSEAYPNDWYQVGTKVAVELPTPFTIGQPAGSKDADIEESEVKLPLKLRIGSTLGMKGYNVFYIPEYDLPLARSIRTVEGPSGAENVFLQKSPDVEQLRLVIVRDLRVRVSSYFVASIPIVFVLMLVYMWLYSGRPPGASTVIETALAMIALLQIRELLVPPEVKGLTRIDILLSLSLLTVVFLALTQFGVEVWKSSVDQESMDIQSGTSPDDHSVIPPEEVVPPQVSARRGAGERAPQGEDRPEVQEATPPKPPTSREGPPPDEPRSGKA
jgi:hypothetical protein